LDEEDEEEPAQKKRKLTQAAKEKLKAKAKAKAKAKQKKEGDDIDSENLDEDEDAYTALPKSLRRGENASPSKPPVGSFETCQKCEKEFTVVSGACNLPQHLIKKTCTDQIYGGGKTWPWLAMPPLFQRIRY
jgi:hypothetical protein